MGRGAVYSAISSVAFAASAALWAGQASAMSAQETDAPKHPGCVFWVDPSLADLEAALANAETLAGKIAQLVETGSLSAKQQKKLTKHELDLKTARAVLQYAEQRVASGQSHTAQEFIFDNIFQWDAANAVMTSPRAFENMTPEAGNRAYRFDTFVDSTRAPQLDMSVERVTFDGDNALLGCPAELRQYVVTGGTEDAPAIPATRPIAPAFWFEPTAALSLNITNKLDLLDDANGHGGHGSHGHHGHVATNHAPQLSSTSVGYIAQNSTAPDYDPQLCDGVDDPAACTPGEVHNKIHMLNDTNIHTHGWHVNPKGRGDNVFIDIQPGNTYEQFVELPADHPSGTFWYHAHLHGATAVQVSSGMAGALVVTDDDMGLDTLKNPTTGDPLYSKDRIMALQQLVYDDTGRVEGIKFIQEAGAQTGDSCNAGANYANRPIFINGVAAPMLSVTVGEIERWRFIHTGSIKGISPEITTLAGTGFGSHGPDGFPTGTDASAQLPPLWEIATDGLPTGQIIPKTSINMEPAYRTSVLFQVTQAMYDTLPDAANGKKYLYLVDNDVKGTTAPTQCAHGGGTISPTIPSARRVMAVLEISPAAVGSTAYDLVDLANPESSNYVTAIRAETEAIRSAYETTGWTYQTNDAGDYDPEKSYAGISPLAPISAQELSQSKDIDLGVAQEHNSDFSEFEDTASDVRRVHYFGDGGLAYDCKEEGGRCTYTCGGTLVEYTGMDGQTYNGTSVPAGSPTCHTSLTALGTPSTDTDLPLINFMICDSLQNLGGFTINHNKQIYDADGNPVDASAENMQKPGTQVTAWDCFKFAEYDALANWVALNSANEWWVSSKGQAGHVFHIHVNPFTFDIAAAADMYQNTTPAHTVWKDTLLAPPSKQSNGMQRMRGWPQKLKTRYTVFPGAFVQHCHILTHEDQGMMQIVSVADRKTSDRIAAALGVDNYEDLRDAVAERLREPDAPLMSQADNATFDLQELLGIK